MSMETITQVKERPIIFSTPMVIATRGGQKYITRRTKGLEEINDRPGDWQLTHTTTATRVGGDAFFIAIFRDGGEERVVHCPYGKTDDILWVRETWQKSGLAEMADAAGMSQQVGDRYIYKADKKNEGYQWKPSIHMPKAACRLKLQIVSIGVERLHDITEEDAIREGVEKMIFLNGEHVGWRNYGKPDKLKPFLNKQFARQSFESLWQSINGKESWDINPWVWRIEFTKIHVYGG